MMQALVNKDPGLKGNLLVERLVGAQVELAPIEDLKKFGSVVVCCLYLVCVSLI